MKKLLTLLFLLFISGVLFAQNTTLKFKTSKNMSVNIYYPIDRFYNEYEYEQIELHPNKISEYKVNVDKFCYVTIKYSDGKKHDLLVTEGNDLEVEYKDVGINFRGVDSVANRFIEDNHVEEYGFALNDIFARNCKEERLNPAKIRAEADVAFSKYYNKMKSVSFSKNTEEIIKNNFHYWFETRIVHNYRTLVKGFNKKLIPEDSIVAINQLKLFYKNDFIQNKDIMKYSRLSSYVSMYYYCKAYFFMSQEEIISLRNKYNLKDFGPYAVSLSAPKDIQNTHLSGIILLQLLLNINELDIEKVFEHLKKLKPESEYIPIIEKRLKEKQLLTDAEKPQFVNGNITSIKMLSEVKELKDKYLYIDLWATWCVPCRAEFTHHKELKKVLSKYSNLAPVYISIDNDKDDAKWRADVVKCHLTGFNIRATKQLVDEFEKVLGNNEGMSIPRYILLNPQGEIIDADLPRPSNIDGLRKVLEKKVPFSITIDKPKSDKTPIFKL